jgi:hypothetical protein
MSKVYLDDERIVPEGWIQVYSAGAAIAQLQTGKVTHISLGHDLGDSEQVGTGYDVILWIEEQTAMFGFVPPEIDIHSANSSAKVKMQLGVESIRKFALNNLRE